MKRNSIKILLIVLILLLLYMVFNQIDAPAPPDIFTQKDLLPTTFERRNRFSQVVAFAESSDVDIFSDETINKYRRLFDPQFEKDNAKEWDHYAYRRLFDKYKRNARFINRSKNDWVSFVDSEEKKIKRLSREFSFFLERYRTLLAAETVSDFTGPRFRVNEEALLTVSRLYTALQIIKTDLEGVEGLLAQVDFSKKLIAGARSSHTVSMGKEILQESLKALGSVMNRDGCAPEVFSLVLKRLPPVTTKELGSRNVFINYFLAVDQWMETVIEKRSREGNVDVGKQWKPVARLFFQKQRTENYYFYYISRCIHYETQPPFKWGVERLTTALLHKQTLWWLQNPTGKFIFSEDLRPNFREDILQTHEAKVYYDLVRISAKLHLKCTGETSVSDVLQQLESFREPDPYSGMRYKWNKEKGILYSVGPNRKDDKGEFDPRRHNKQNPPDIVLPYHLNY
ncbi:MAG: hypothetical protein GY950_14905 [bacterium]|nr:hypothetical protein [bacterium]